MLLDKLNWAIDNFIPQKIFTLEAEKNWKSLNIDYEHPHVHRLWMDMDKDFRIYLHKIFPSPGNSLFHPHPWESAIKIFRGRYEMGIGHSEDGYKTPEIDATIILPPGSEYDMSNANGWHYVKPLDGKPVYSIMITGKQFSNPVTNIVWEEIEKKLDPLGYGQKMEIISEFQEFFRSFGYIV